MMVMMIVSCFDFIHSSIRRDDDLYLLTVLASSATRIENDECMYYYTHTPHSFLYCQITLPF